ncbi:MAG: YdcF family protein [Planctomycetes bacterium]|jgi:uncharacterized SAM-binding protein YcdF (DUF218 family)|nr:YdcF family protein [Planctomycetota bacterium]
MVVLKSFATPVAWVLVLLLLGLLLTSQTRRRRLYTSGRCLLLLGTVLLFALSFHPVANLLTYPLEAAYAPPSAEVLAKLDIIVVLGGGFLPSGSLRPEAELKEPTYPRFYRGVQAFRQSGADLLVFCGGPDTEGPETESETMKAMALSLGIPEDKILTETQSQTTFENAARLSRVLPAGQDRRIGLVTAATHMRRSYRVFCRQFPDDVVVPIPACYSYSPPRIRARNLVPSVGNLDKSNAALHEWLGLVWYSLRGW